MNQYVLDVESDGPVPGAYNMISFALVNVEDHTKTFQALLKPIVMSEGVPEARNVSGISFQTQVLEGQDPKEAMEAAQEFLGGKRAIIWSDNPAYDWMFWAYYCHVYTGRNQAGFSARRIGDFYAGLQKDPKNTQGWKKLRQAPHDHDPLNDALGNAQALKHLLQSAGTKETPSWTEEMENQLSSLVAEGKQADEIAKIMGRTEQSIKYKTNYMGLYIKGGSRSGLPWTEKELEELRAWDEQHSLLSNRYQLKKFADKVQRKTSAVSSRVKKLYD